MKHLVALAASLSLIAPLAAQAQRTVTPPAAMSAIRQQDLHRDLFTLAGDSMRGREAGTLDEMRASMWLADQMRRIGLAPRGDDGTFFQWWDMHRTRVSPSATSVSVSGHSYPVWHDAIPLTTATTSASGPTVFVTDLRDSTHDLTGKVAVAELVAPPAAAVRTTTNTYQYNYARASIALASRALMRRGAAAVILVAEPVTDSVFDDIALVQARGFYDVVGGVPRFSRNPNAARQAAATAPAPVVLLRRSALGSLHADGQPADIRVNIESFETPSVNVIGEVRGTDPKLRNEYVIFSSHQDHDGVRFTVNGDSIWNGADDNASTSVALLAIARAWVKQPGKRSALFIFHGAEERGLLGSRYFVAHPVLPLDSIVAVLHGDMIGRNNPDTAALLGSQPPHRNSVDLVQMALDANRAVSRFVIDSSWDRPTHPEGWYFRSDHVPYAERGVPSLFFSTNLHPDYHTPRDEPERIDYPKLTRMTKWMYMTGWIAANAPKRPATDAGFVLH
jgi:Zn-dependent M28 family amino/carboxypeptidase